MAFGGQPRGVFGVAPGRVRFSLAQLEPLLDAAHARLDGVVLENLPWQDVLNRWDSAGTLFYLDPPYWNGENDYGKGLFERSHFAEMAEMLATIKGSFVLSINDRPEVREIFAGFEMDRVSLTYTVAKGGATEAQELIVSNRKPRTELI